MFRSSSLTPRCRGQLPILCSAIQFSPKTLWRNYVTKYSFS